MSRLDDLKAKTTHLLHGIQSAIAYGFGDDPNPTREHKHLRVGIDNALISHSALAVALMRKGVITEEEYFEAYVEMLELEVMNYESEARRRGMDNIRFR